MSESTSESGALARRVTATEREHAVTRLTTAFTEDAIAVGEFERRVAEVYRAESAEALQEVTRDLPAPSPAEGGTLPAPVERSTALARPPRQQVRCVLSSVERRLQGPVPEHLHLRSIAGSLEVDLRRAEFPAGVTEIHVDAVLANIEIELPDHVDVEDEGSALLGNFSVRGRSRPGRGGGTAVVRIVGRAVLSNVEVEQDD